MPEIVLKAGRASEVTQPERRAALQKLREQLESIVGSVSLQIAEYVPGRRGVAWPESVAIYVAGAVSGSLLSNLVTDIYQQARNWAKAHFTEKLSQSADENVRPEWFTIYGPDNQVLKTWKIDKDGEHEN